MSELKEIEKELASIENQIVKVEANSLAVDNAIAGRGTYRGYSGEDCFLKDNLRVVQREMMKQLKRKARGLNCRKRQLLTRAASVSSAPGTCIFFRC